MENEEAIKILERQEETAKELTDYEDYIYALSVGIKAIEKQIPKKLMEEELAFGKTYKDYLCPCCFNYIANDRTAVLIKKEEKVPINFCDFCGQRLDWS